MTWSVKKVLRKIEKSFYPNYVRKNKINKKLLNRRLRREKVLIS